MKNTDNQDFQDLKEALELMILEDGEQYAQQTLEMLYSHALSRGLSLSNIKNTFYENSISIDNQIDYPGNLELEEKILSFIRWNSLLMVLKANKELDLGGHISTYSSAATLYEVGFNHFFRGVEGELGDIIYFQGHSSPGIYARSFLENRLSVDELDNFRRELNGKGLSSYPHPWLMPDYWSQPTVSMGLGPIMSIYQAHVMRYLEKRGLIEHNPDRKVWAFLGDGEMDEPESLGAISLAAREKLDNLNFVINCNLQRLDGPVRGNSQVITELSRQFEAAGWNVLKVIWGSGWDELIANDSNGKLQKIMNETVDGEYQNFKAKGGSYTREYFFGKDPECLNMVKDFSDEQIEQLNRGGHDPVKIFNAYKKSYEIKDKPTVILAFTVKGFGMGSKQADNAAHQVKKLTKDNLKDFIEYFNLPIKEGDIESQDYISLDSYPELSDYLFARRTELGGSIPQRKCSDEVIEFDDSLFAQFDDGDQRESSTTMQFVKILTKLLRDKANGGRVVPIVPDEARTFGMDSLFRQFGIYSSEGQKYTPQDSDKVMFYRESEDGVILEEGINEAGAFSAWLALATSYSNNLLPMIPFYIFYSMFGFQRIHDLAWAAGDSRAKGFLLGATSGRTTLNGEGLQHQDGHSHLLASTIPNCKSYDPCFSYELSTIIKCGVNDMYVENNDRYYYLTLMNENYIHPPRPKGLTDQEIMDGAYKISSAKQPLIRFLASGVTLRFALQAQEELSKMGIQSEVWSITSFNELYKGGIKAERLNLTQSKDEKSYVEKCFNGTMPTIAVSEYQRSYANQIRKWVGGEFLVLGTDGYGRSDTRDELRKFFEIDKNNLVINALHLLGKSDEASAYKKKNKINFDEMAPWEK